jgi:uncharacterized C2H2 Zn-finger protein
MTLNWGEILTNAAIFFGFFILGYALGLRHVRRSQRPIKIWRVARCDGCGAVYRYPVTCLPGYTTKETYHLLRCPRCSPDWIEKAGVDWHNQIALYQYLVRYAARMSPAARLRVAAPAGEEHDAAN